MTSVFDIFKIGIGPSSSHTMGPMVAARMFTDRIVALNLLAKTDRVSADLFGSLALTGRGHGTHHAIILGFEGETPETIDVNAIPARLARVRNGKRLRLAGRHWVEFDEKSDVRFRMNEVLTQHSNGMWFHALDIDGYSLLTEDYYSVGGGFVVGPGQGSSADGRRLTNVPFPFGSAADLLAMGKAQQMTIAAMVAENERFMTPERDVDAGLLRLWGIMQACAARGFITEGELPGGLRVQRRAPGIARRLQEAGTSDPLHILDWVNAYAMAINEENAAGGRVVTAPTNGSAGLIPAVLYYYTRFIDGASDAGVCRFLLTAGAIGVLYQTNASISGAAVGCQGEVGVACSMAAAGLVAALGGTNEQVEHAAEIGMEHHLGMTCDPVGGLVQIPCIERNAVGAVKAINAARLALGGSGVHRVSLDEVIATMKQTGRDMQDSYKETALAGLAVNVVEC